MPNACALQLASYAFSRSPGRRPAAVACANCGPRVWPGRLWQRSRSATAPVHVATGAVCIVRPRAFPILVGNTRGGAQAYSLSLAAFFAE
jgi:hypothetical protein